jgi:hypothetical protein
MHNSTSMITLEGGRERGEGMMITELKPVCVCAEAGNAKANGREPKSCSGRVFNLKLDRFCHGGNCVARTSTPPSRVENSAQVSSCQLGCGLFCLSVPTDDSRYKCARWSFFFLFFRAPTIDPLGGRRALYNFSTLHREGVREREREREKEKNLKYF